MKKTYFVFSDVHGEYDALIKGLQEAGYDNHNKNHVLVSIGDNFDRGPKSLAVWKYLRDNNAICVMGNHDLMFKEYLDKGMDGEFVLFNILHNGLGETISSFGNVNQSQFSIEALNEIRNRILRTGVREWINKMLPYFETKHCIFVHAGLDPMLTDWHDTDEHFRLWDIENSHLPIPSVDKLVVIGHHHAFRVRRNAQKDGLIENTATTVLLQRGSVNIRRFGNTDEHGIWIHANKMAVDGCTNYTGKVNIAVIEDEPLVDENAETEVNASIDINNGEGIRIVSDNFGGYTVNYNGTTMGNILNDTFVPW